MLNNSGLLQSFGCNEHTLLALDYYVFQNLAEAVLGDAHQ